MAEIAAGESVKSGGFALLSFGGIGASLWRGDIALAVGIMTILVVLILPLPAILLDLFLAVSIILSVLILMTALFIKKPLEFSAFPAILLVATLFRLGLNIASTRLILGHGHEGPDAAGEIIAAFGAFIMQGNFVIGLIVFIILVLVNFIVITKGSTRIAEVAARFSLDAMPGKQMAIDADLAAGTIDDTESKRRRKELEDENGFFGAMDGASKFVRGDAVASIIVTVVNVLDLTQPLPGTRGDSRPIFEWGCGRAARVKHRISFWPRKSPSAGLLSRGRAMWQVTVGVVPVACRLRKDLQL